MPHTTTPSSSSRGSSKVRSAAATLAAPAAAAQPIDDLQKVRRGIQRRTFISSTDPYILLSSSGTDNPDLPPVLGFKCVKHNYTQVLDHFAEAHTQQADALGQVHDGVGQVHGEDQASTHSKSLHWDSDSDLWELEADEAAKKKQQWRKQKTFTQVYWVCDATWPTDRHEQVRHSVSRPYIEWFAKELMIQACMHADRTAIVPWCMLCKTRP
jgi:hypothetical protein